MGNSLLLNNIFTWILLCYNVLICISYKIFFAAKSSMKFIVCLYFIALFPSFCLADDGFDIGRPKAPCYAVLTGVDKLGGYEVLSTGDYGNSIVTNNDTIPVYYTEDTRWEGPIKLLIRNKATLQVIDTLILSAEGYHLRINFTGIENNKVKYIIDKSKAVYPYRLFPGENISAAAAKRNKFILVFLSVVGFISLGFMYKRRNAGISLEE